jgi:hypothetical protein
MSKPTPTVKLKSYWGEITEKPLRDFRICQSIYPCCTDYFVTATYDIDGVNGPVAQSHTIAACKSYEEARAVLAKAEASE